MLSSRTLRGKARNQGELALQGGGVSPFSPRALHTDTRDKTRPPVPELVEDIASLKEWSGGGYPPCPTMLLVPPSWDETSGGHAEQVSCLERRF